MARNKYPDRTEKLIIEVATKLFLEKGYENTSLNDIIANLGGLTKGAIYQHFGSKEDILNAVMYQVTASSDDKLLELINSKDLSAKEKIKAVLLSSINESARRKETSIVIDYTKNPLIFRNMFTELINEVAPVFIRPLIEEGIKEGTIKTDSPKELSEFLAIMLNIWVNPAVCPATPEEAINKYELLSQMLKQMGLDIVDEEVLNAVRQMY